MNDIYTWPQDLYPLVKQRFDLRYADRMDIISKLCEVITQDAVDYRFEGVGGYGEIPVYDGANIAEADQKRAFITTVTPKEHALKVTMSYKKTKIDQSRESEKVGTRLADSAYMTVLNEFYRLFGSAFTTLGADGKPWASDAHRVNSESDETFSNVLHSALSVSAITAAQTKASGFVTPDGLPFAGNFDLLLVGPELEPKAKEICGPNSRLIPEKNPDGDAPENAANPVYGMKYLVDRERPYDKYPDRVHPYSHESSPSFPSGHTATAFALATSLSVKYPKWYVIAPSALWACSVGVSRMNEGVHYPSDVLTGAAIGAGCAVANIYINRWLNRWLFGK